MDTLNQIIYGAAVVCGTLVLLTFTATFCYSLWQLARVLHLAMTQVEKDIKSESES